MLILITYESEHELHRCYSLELMDQQGEALRTSVRM